MAHSGMKFVQNSDGAFVVGPARVKAARRKSLARQVASTEPAAPTPTLAAISVPTPRVAFRRTPQAVPQPESASTADADRAYVTLLFNKYRVALQRYLSRLVPAEDAAELVQETYFRLLRHGKVDRKSVV